MRQRSDGNGLISELRDAASLAACAMPRGSDWKGGLTGARGSTRAETDYFLPDQANLASWATPTSRDHKDGASVGTAADECATGSPSLVYWTDPAWIACRDGKSRPVEPGTFPLAHGAPARVVRLRGYGNAICEPQARARSSERSSTSGGAE
jgi:DNA (cytosine-5)-methyltransferase 1